MGTARIVRDIFHLVLRASAQSRIMHHIEYFKVTVNAVEKDVYSRGFYTLYDSDVQPYRFAYIFYGLFDVSEPNSTLDSVDLLIRSDCNYYSVRLYLLANTPLVVPEPGIYGILITYEYQPPETVEVRVLT